MNWDAIGAIGEIIGAVAVVATLLYLSAQIRQSNRATKSASIQEAATAMNELNGWVVGDESLARIYRVGLANYADLNEDEAVRFSLLMLSAFHVFETIFLQNRVGTIESSVWDAETRSLRAMVAQAGCAHWWQQNPYAFTQEFRSFVNQQIETST